MSLTETIKETLNIIESNRQILSEPAVKKTIAPLEKAALNFLKSTEPYQNIDWPAYLQLSNVLSQTKITKSNIDQFNTRLKKFGVSFSAPSKPAKQQFALDAARSGKAAQILEELQKSPEAVMKAKIYELAGANNPDSEVSKMSDKNLKTYLKHADLKEKKTKKNNKTVFDRTANEAAFLNYLKEIKFRIGS